MYSRLSPFGLIVSVAVMLAVLLSPAYGQQRYANQKRPIAPPINKYDSIPPRQEVHFYRLAVFPGCDQMSGAVSTADNRLGIDLVSDLFGMGFTPQSTDTSVTLTVSPLYKDRTIVRSSPFHLPNESFNLRVIIDEDTALCRVEVNNSVPMVEYVDSLPFLIVEPWRAVPEDVIAVQLDPAVSGSDVTRLVKELQEQIDCEYGIVPLPAGYYPCLPVPFVSVAAIGRRHPFLVNETEAGYLICIQLTTEACRDQVNQAMHRLQKRLASRK